MLIKGFQAQVMGNIIIKAQDLKKLCTIKIVIALKNEFQ